MSSDNPKADLLAQFALVAKALAHANRLELVDLIAQGERSVAALAERSGLTVANTSQHLHQLRGAGLLSSRRDGKHVMYSLQDPSVLDLLTALQRVAKNNIDEVKQIVDGYFHERDAMEPVSRAQLIDRMQHDIVTVLDVRPADEYHAGHVPGALNITIAELEHRLTELPRNQEIVAYCRGAFCVLSFEAVAVLRSNGFSVRRLEDGFPEWRIAGLPIASSAAAT